MAFATHVAARSASDPLASAVCRAAGYAVATANVADHELGAAAYATKAVRLASEAGTGVDPHCVYPAEAGRLECRWQREQLPEAIRELVLSDQVQRGERFGLVSSC